MEGVIGKMIYKIDARKNEVDYIVHKFGDKQSLIDREAREVFGIASIASQIKCSSSYNYTGI